MRVSDELVGRAQLDGAIPLPGRRLPFTRHPRLPCVKTRILTATLIVAACLQPASAQIYPSIADLGHTADLIAFATVDHADATRGSTSPDATLTVQLRLNRVLKGAPASLTVLATLAERCAGGGSGRGPVCIAAPDKMVGLTGLWFLRFGDTGCQILPLHKSTWHPEELLLPISDNFTGLPTNVSLEDTLLADHVRWIQSLPEPAGTFDDERFFTAFEPWTSQHLDQQEVLTAIAPLLASDIPWRHAIGLVIALRADSAAAMTQMIDELSTLQSNPRFSEIVFAIGAYPGSGPGTKGPAWIAPLRRLLALHTDLPGMDAAIAGALYRVGTNETWPLVASLLESKDPNARTIAARTMSLHFAAAPPVQPPQPPDPAFWKVWWDQNRGAMIFP